MKSSNIVFETESDKSGKKGADKEFYINSENRGFFPYPQNPFPRTNNNVSPFFGKERERIEDWLYIVELVLEGNSVSQDKQKIIFACSYLRDAALHEYQSFVSKNNAFGDINYKQKNVLNIHDLGKTNELLKLFTFINNQKIKAVFDPRATISLMSLEVAERLKIMISHSSQKINTADGNTHNVLGETEPIKIEIGEVIANISFVITNISHEDDLDESLDAPIYNVEDDKQSKLQSTGNKVLDDLILKNKDVFSLSINDCCFDGVKFEIETSSETPIMSQPFRQPLVLIEEMKKEVNKMLNAGIIIPGKAGTWASPAF
ncbi:unnamed protein product [Brachionus calyciflorus]|uniref:Uncharacterized protein n=1 Tax=Brachionus calyciflorus TaxID=104777 RepID=A0A814PF76_9BILA|nr:unnamed protein product [Brachionus calyciflorus]